MSIASLYPSINPSLLLDFANVKRLDPRITFTRTTTATYYDGVTTAKAEENLLLQSQTFDNAAWTKSGSSVTANAAVAPDGTTTADKLVESNLTEPHNVYQGVSFLAATYTFSWYAKAAGRSWVHTRGALAGQTYFDVTNGVLGTVPAGVTATITSVGNGWYRCTVSETISSGSGTVQIACGTANNTDSTAGDGTSGVFLWGAQLEQRSSATAYTATTTQAITNYIPVLQTASSGQARFDHNPTTGESLGLLIEEARTNLMAYSNDFSNAAWSKDSCTVSSNVVIAPDGTLTGDKIVSASATAQTGVGPSSVTVTTADYTATFFVKQSEAQFVQISWNTSLSTNYANFDILNGTVTAGTYTSASITLVGNGWYRISITSALSAATGRPYLWLINSGTSARNASYTGNGWNGIYVWGGQLEVGSFATSYIPTVASSVTRNADTAIMTGTNFSSWFNNGEGTVYSESTPTAQTSNGHVLFSLLSTAGQNFIASGQYIANSMVRSIIVDVNAVNQVLLVGSNGANNKIAAAYKANDFAGSINGSAASTDTSGTVPVVAQAYLGSFGTFGQPYTGTIKKLAYYPIRVTNAQLQALTV